MFKRCIRNIPFLSNIYTIYISTDTCFVLPKTHQCGSGLRVYIYIYISCKMQSRFQQKMHLVYHTQNCLLWGRGNLNCLFYYHNCFLWIFLLFLSKNRCSCFIKKCSSNVAVVHSEVLQRSYTSLGTQIMCPSWRTTVKKYSDSFKS